MWERHTPVILVQKEKREKVIQGHPELQSHLEASSDKVGGEGEGNLICAFGKN